MRFAPLGSGSKGNATLIEGGGTRLLLDCGFPLAELERRLAVLGVAVDTLSAVLVTHEHGDHMRGTAALARRHRLPVWMTGGTCRAGWRDDLPEARCFSSHQGAFTIGALRIHPFPVPHDAREPAQFVLEHAGARLGIFTDAGGVTPHIVEMLQGCDALMLECNHDPAMLANGPYPPFLRSRVGGAYGHLSNRQAAGLLGRLDHRRLRHLVAAHLSEKNNSPELARQALLEAAPDLEDRLGVSDQDTVGAWHEL